MFFTSQNFSLGQQDAYSCPSPRLVFSPYEKNWPSTFIGSERVGTSSERCSWLGGRENIDDCKRKSDVELLAQNLFSMKNARKQLGEIAAKDATQINPGPIVSDNPDALPLFENQIFHEKPRPRQPESPDAESFRSWLKTNSPKHKASPALLERIKSIIHDDKA